MISSIPRAQTPDKILSELRFFIGDCINEVCVEHKIVFKGCCSNWLEGRVPVISADPVNQAYFQDLRPGYLVKPDKTFYGAMRKKLDKSGWVKPTFVQMLTEYLFYLSNVFKGRWYGDLFKYLGENYMITRNLVINGISEYYEPQPPAVLVDCSFGEF